MLLTLPTSTPNSRRSRRRTRTSRAPRCPRRCRTSSPDSATTGPSQALPMRAAALRTRRLPAASRTGGSGHMMARDGKKYKKTDFFVILFLHYWATGLGFFFSFLFFPSFSPISLFPFRFVFSRMGGVYLVVSCSSFPSFFFFSSPSNPVAFHTNTFNTHASPFLHQGPFPF
ncbi:hypothetical protein VTK73DRAFT_4122 [Phialemonium thermophilum]|uniref:Uncharacterized protein n=1 Tax=Phialemonium thermophilum TaxID=223376 RepID=A0ABR3WV39_9PEZI